jgi:hypothetical protein
VFYASAANTITGPVVDQADIFHDLANPSFQDQVAVVRLHEMLLRIRRKRGAAAHTCAWLDRISVS